jgi:hypothetical protein
VIGRGRVEESKHLGQYGVALEIGLGPQSRTTTQLQAMILVIRQADDGLGQRRQVTPSGYLEVVRPSMMVEHVGAGFSGLLSTDHRQLLVVLIRIKPLMAATATHFACKHQQLPRGLNYVYENPKFVCARFDGDSNPNLRCPHSSAVSGVDQLQRYHRAACES